MSLTIAQVYVTLNELGQYMLKMLMPPSPGSGQRSLYFVSTLPMTDTAARTLNIGDALVENLLECLGVLKLLLDLGNDGLGKLLLLPLLDLALVADPRVENNLGLVGNGGLLLELESLGLELGGLLCGCQYRRSLSRRRSVVPWKPRRGSW
jgi:hypothetical protein